ncbi:Fe2+-dependent dioxygenase [Ponticaulis profundi]|uniref:Fe2+-dependent dioxygenase n=1 Tax=Ponticaulis profundi TaxID=2665222 RepID=A0ABW1SDD1_9PROT
MFLTVGNALTEKQLADTRKALALINWRSGKETAGPTARAVKENDQADLNTKSGKSLRDALKKIIFLNPIVQAYARPARISAPLISRTRNGGGYGLHVDNTVMGRGAEQVRTDLSFTLFLNDPESYEGGALAIEHSGRTHRAKCKAGDMVIYPSTTLHGVEPVMSGERIVCVGWIQSAFRSADQRDILFDLENLKTELAKSYDANSPEMLTLAKTMGNLKRMWMD